MRWTVLSMHANEQHQGVKGVNYSASVKVGVVALSAVYCGFELRWGPKTITLVFVAPSPSIQE